MREKDISKQYMHKILSNKEKYDSATHLYTQSLIKNIEELQDEPNKSAREREVLLKYLKELEGILQIKSNIWTWYTPIDNVDDDDSL